MQFLVIPIFCLQLLFQLAVFRLYCLLLNRLQVVLVVVANTHAELWYKIKRLASIDNGTLFSLYFILIFLTLYYNIRICISVFIVINFLRIFVVRLKVNFFFGFFFLVFLSWRPFICSHNIYTYYYYYFIKIFFHYYGCYFLTS